MGTPSKLTTDFDPAGHFGLPRSVETWLKVTAAPEEIARHRTAFDHSSFREIDEEIAKLGREETPLLYWDCKSFFLHRDHAVSRLRQVWSDFPMTPCGVDSAALLIALCDEEGFTIGSQILRHSPHSDRYRFLYGLSFALGRGKEYDPAMSYSKLIESREGFSQLLIDQITVSHLEVAYIAEEIVRDLGIRNEDRVTRLRQLLSASDPSIRELAFHRLPIQEITLEQFEIVLQSGNAQRFILGFLESPDRSICGRAQAWTRDYLDQTFAVESAENGWDRIEMYRKLAQLSEADELKWLKGASEREKGATALVILRELYRRDAALCRQTILAEDAPRENLWHAIAAAENILSRSNDVELVDRLVRLSVFDDEANLGLISRVLVALDGQAAKSALRAILPRLTYVQRASVLQQWNDYCDIECFLLVCQELGILNQEHLAQFKACHEEQPLDRPPNDPGVHIDILKLAGRVVELWPRDHWGNHVRVLNHFSRASGGRFRPHCLLDQRWIDRNHQEFHRMKFLHDGNLYEGWLKCYGGSMDADRLISMINRALHNSGVSERFVRVDTHIGSIQFVFAEPRHMARLANQFHLPVAMTPYMYADNIWRESNDPDDHPCPDEW